TVMAGFLETIETAGFSDAELNHKALTHLHNQTQRMQRLVDDLLTLSRLEDGHNKLQTTAIDVPSLIAALKHDAEQLSRGQHRIVVQLGKEWLQGNQSEITSAFSNLINNAVRYTPPGSEIQVSWQREGNGLVFKVSDNGEGIAPEHIPRLTERFYRVDRGRSRASGGTGLGLAIVKHVLMRHGARLDISSAQDASHHGTTFAAVFPENRLATSPSG
ncbi:MAG: PAS domain-containing sensor histidine kinase, partial [Betaproteobacteria bacterium]|nr:PAS domain-containing sensor histidine kinase [Betaproteobacteria bacterium]